MAREVEEWVGKTEDSKIPDRVKDRVLRRSPNRCQSCGSLLRGQAVEFDHKIALINWAMPGHGNRESNLWAIGSKCCHIDKTKRDVAEKSKVYKKRLKMSGIERPSRNPVPGSRRSRLGKRYNRETGLFEAYWRD